MDIFTYGFMQRALIAGMCIGVSTAILGLFLVLRRFSMLGDGLAHSAFASIGIAMVVGVAPLYFAIPFTIAASLWIYRLADAKVVYGDTAIAMVSTLAIAVGVLAASLSGGFNIDLFSYLFGSIISVTTSEVVWAAGISIFTVAVLWYFYHDLFSLTYDEDFARVSGIHVGVLQKVLVVLAACTIVVGIRVVGTLLISSLLIFPAVTALQIAHSFKKAAMTAVFMSVVAVFSGIVMSALFNLPTGVAIVAVNFILFVIAFIAGRVLR